VPANRFDAFMLRLRETEYQHDLITFLATRCSRKFLSSFLATNSDFGSSLTKVSSPLWAAGQVVLLSRLHELKLLHEDWRSRFVKNAQKLAVDMADVSMFSSERVRKLFNADELTSLRETLKDELIPYLADMISTHGDECDDDTDPEDWFSDFRDAIATLEDEFKEPDVAADIARADRAIDRAIDSINETRWQPDEPEYDEVSSAPHGPTARSIFDDVDD
jgi:hypothetical protein